MTLDRISDPERYAAFYGQSVSLVAFLANRDEPQRLLHFANQASNVGYDEALKANYGIKNVGQLQRLWLDSVAPGSSGLHTYTGSKLQAANVNLARLNP